MVGIDCEEVEMESSDKLCYLGDKIPGEELTDIEENPELIDSYEFPDFIISLTLVNTLDFEFSDDVLIDSVEKILLDKIKIQGNIEETTFDVRISRSRSRYSARLFCKNGEKEENKKRINDLEEEILLVKKFPAYTSYGKVVDSEFPKQILREIPREHWYNVTTILDEPTVYLCFSSDLAKELKSQLNEIEYISLPQIDFSDYVEELNKIIKSPLFLKICSGEYLSVIMDNLTKLKNDDYTGFSKSFDIIEHMLKRICTKVGSPAQSMGDALDTLASNSLSRRLFNETEYLIRAIGRNTLAHGVQNRPKWDEKYISILSIKAIRDIFLDWCFFEAFYICLQRLSQQVGEEVDELWIDNLNDITKRERRLVEYNGDYEKMQFKIKHHGSPYSFEIRGEDLKELGEGTK